MWHSFGWYSKFITFMFGNRCKFWPIIEDQHLICFLVTIRDWSYDSMLNADWRFRDVYFWRFWIIRKLWSCKLTNHRGFETVDSTITIEGCKSVWTFQKFSECISMTGIIVRWKQDFLPDCINVLIYLFIYWFIHLF